MIKDQRGQSTPVQAYQQWLTTISDQLVSTIPEQTFELHPSKADAILVSPAIAIFLKTLLNEPFPVDPPKSPEEKLAKQLIKKYVKEQEAKAKKAELEAKKAALMEAHPEWAEFNPQVPYHGCFGYLNGHLILGARHHQAIMAMLLDKGWTWEELFNATQVWGWYTINGPNFHDPWFNPDAEWQEPSVSVSFVSDAAIMNEEAAEGCIEAFKEIIGVQKVTGGVFSKNRDVRRHGLEYGGDFDRHYKNNRGELVLPNEDVVYQDVTPLPEPPSVQKAMVP